MLVTIGIRVAGEWRIIEAGRPVDMIAFEDKFGVPGPDPEGGQMWRQVSWLAHRIDAPGTDFDTWLQTIDDITADADGIAAARAAIAGEPEPPANVVGIGTSNGDTAGKPASDPFPVGERTGVTG